MKILEFKHQQDNIYLQNFNGDEDGYTDLLRWQTDESILEFYHGRDKTFVMNKLKSKYQEMIATSDVYPCLIKLNETNIGYLQFFMLKEDGEYSYEGYDVPYEKNMYAFDLFIGEKKYWGKGIGSKLLFELSRYLFEKKSASVIYVDPRVKNTRAIKAYENAGFTKKKILKEHEMFEGKRRDSWLMEYRATLKEELR